MANNTRSALRDAIQKRKRYVEDYQSLFTMLFHNSVQIENLPSDLPKRYLLRVLMNKGGIAYDKETKVFLPFVKSGIDMYGLPLRYTLIGYNGIVYTRDAKDVVILRANDIEFPIKLYIENQVQKIVDYDLAIEQNLEAIKTMSIAEMPDDKSLLSLLNLQNAKRIGATIAYVNKKSMTGTELKLQSTNAQYLIDKLRQDRKECLNETLSTIGINVANVDKRERVQNAEIRASQGFALDCISTLCETFNHDAELGGLDIRLKGNTSLSKQFDLEEIKVKAEIEELKKGENSNE